MFLYKHCAIVYIMEISVTVYLAVCLCVCVGGGGGRGLPFVLVGLLHLEVY